MRPNPWETADLVIFTEEILNGKFIFCAVKIIGHWIQRYFKIAHYDKKCKKGRFIGVICQAV